MKKQTREENGLVGMCRRSSWMIFFSKGRVTYILWEHSFYVLNFWTSCNPEDKSIWCNFPCSATLALDARILLSLVCIPLPTPLRYGMVPLKLMIPKVGCIIAVCLLWLSENPYYDSRAIPVFLVQRKERHRQIQKKQDASFFYDKTKIFYYLFCFSLRVLCFYMNFYYPFCWFYSFQ